MSESKKWIPPAIKQAVIDLQENERNQIAYAIEMLNAKRYTLGAKLKLRHEMVSAEDRWILHSVIMQDPNMVAVLKPCDGRDNIRISLSELEDNYQVISAE